MQRRGKIPTISTPPSSKRGSLSKYKKAPPPCRPFLSLLACFAVPTLVWYRWHPPFRTASSTTSIESVRAEFYERYGGQVAAEEIFRKGIQAFGSVDATAHRLLMAAARQEPFVLSFAGYSVTVGRGNYYKQSFPFVLQRILEPLVQATLDISVKVRNAAIGGIPSFPYGFCFEHFLGTDSDAISWDYSMNEGNGDGVLEAYIRHSQTQLAQPMLIVLDTNEARCRLLQHYTSKGLLKDALCVGMAKDVMDVKALIGNNDKQLPIGFQDWEKFGAPDSCPGRGSWHPRYKEHELIGWMIAMYFVQAVERAVAIQNDEPHWKDKFRTMSWPMAVFPAPLASKLPHNEDISVGTLFYGHKVDSNYMMKNISCRTNFLPAIDEDKILPSIVVSGLTNGVTAENILTVRTDEQYASGWVLDVSEVERDTKIKVEKCGGLGYVDMKIALYGVPESGKLRLWLHANPHSHEEHDDLASHWFSDLVICEANEKRLDSACHLDKDIQYTVGGVVVEKTAMIKGAGEYLKRQTCVHVGIPAGAKVTPLRDLRDDKNAPVSVDTLTRLSTNPAAIGLQVDIEAKGKVTRKGGACCISHVVWEHHDGT